MRARLSPLARRAAAASAARPHLEPLEDRRLLAAELDIVLGDAAARKLIFTDDDGTRVQVQHRHGTATVHLSGTDLEQQVGNRDIQVTGSGITIDSIAYADTTFRSTTKIKTSSGGDGATSLGEVTGETPVGKLLGKRVSLVGAGILMTGNGVIASVTLADVLGGADIDMPGNAPRKGHKLTFDLVETGTEMTFASDIRTFKAESWLDGSLTATEARTLKIAGNFSGDWTLTAGGARNITIGGSVLSGEWEFAGNARKLKVKRSFAADVTATSFRKIKIDDAFTGSIAATATGGRGITKMKVKGPSTDARISSVADVKKLTLDDVTNLEVYIGLPAAWPGGLPTDLDDLARGSRVKKLTVKGTTTGATLVADEFRKLNLRRIVDTADFDLAARRVKKATMRLDGDRYTFRNDRIFSEAPSLPYLNFVQLA